LKRVKVKIVLKKFFIFISACFILLCLFILFIGPLVVNQVWFQAFVEKQICKNLMTPLEIEKINFSWSEGVCIHSIKLYPEFSADQPFIRLEKINVHIPIYSLFKRKPMIILNLKNINVQYTRYSEKKNTLSNWLERLNQNQNQKKQHIHHPKSTPKKSFSLPFDIQSNVSITGLFIDYQDHLLKKQISLTHTNLDITTDSIRTRPINIQLQSNIEIDHKGGFPFEFGLNIGNILQNDKNITLEKGFLFIAQNSKINWQGAVNKNLYSDLKIGPVVIDCDEIYPKIQAFLPITFLSKSDKMPVIKINQLFLKTNPSTKENYIQVIQGSVGSDYLSYENNQLQLCSKKMLLNIPEFTLTQKSSTWMDIVFKNLSLNIPTIEFTHDKLGTITDSFRLSVSVERMGVNMKDILSSYISGTGVSFQLGDVLNFHTENIDMKNQHVDFVGKAIIDLTNLSNKGLLFLKQNDIKMNGQTEISLHIKGALPKKDQKIIIPELSDLNMQKNIPFLEQAKLAIALKKVSLERKPQNESGFEIGPLSTKKVLSYLYRKKHGTGNLSAHLMVENLDKILKIKQNKPLDADIRITASHKDLKKLRISQDVFIKNWGLKHTVKADISGLHRVIGVKEQLRIPDLVRYLGGSIKNNFILTDVSKLESFISGLQLKGALNIGSNIYLIPKKKVNIKLFSNTDGIDVHLDQRLDINEFKAALDLNKTFHLAPSHQTPKKQFMKTRRYLSSEVMNTSNARSNILNSQPERNNRFFGQFQKVYGDKPSLSFRSLHLKTDFLPIEMNDAAIYFDLIDGMPHLERFQFEIWEGTVITSAMVIKQENKDVVRFQMNFSGIDFNKILKNEGHDFGTDSEINGQLFTMIPMTFQLKEVLSGLDFRLRFNHIGRLALERLLYSLDPYENNEVIVSQRTLLKTGSPIWIEIVIRDGNLSLTGEFIVAGLRINLPALKRFKITGISGLEHFEQKQIGFESAYKTILERFRGNILPKN
jgi:hypothetical protein